MTIKDTTSTPIIPRTHDVAPARSTDVPAAETRPAAKQTDGFDAQGRTAVLDRKPANDVVPGSGSRGLVVPQELKEKLAPYLKERPQKGFGYIIAEGDVLDQLLQEAYEDGEGEGQSDEDRLDKWIAAFLMYNRHLGLSTPDALHMAIGQLCFFPELAEMLDTHLKLSTAVNPLNFPAIEKFLQVASLPVEAAGWFHFVPAKMPTSSAELRKRVDGLEERRGLGKRTKRLRFDTVQGSMSRIARQAGSVLIGLVEEARQMQQTKRSVSPATTSNGEEN